MTIHPRRSANLRPGVALSGCCARTLGVLLLGVTLLGLMRAGAAPADPSHLFRFGFSPKILGDKPETELNAAMRVWARSVVSNSGAPIDPNPLVLGHKQNVNSVLRAGEIDGVALTVPEFFELDEEQRSADVFVNVIDGSAEDQYLLLVRSDGDIRALKELKGRDLIMFESPRMALARPWLATILPGAGSADPDDFFGDVKNAPKLTQAVLPVFFGRATGCVVNRKGFESMAELNPQVSKNLKRMAASPGVVPTLFMFRNDYKETARREVENALSELHLSIQGKQMLLIFQTDKLVRRPVAVLDASRRLLTASRSEPV